MAEQLPLKQLVGGSSPPGRTRMRYLSLVSILRNHI